MSILFWNRRLIRALRRLIDEVKSDLPPENIDDARVYVQAGEWWEALDLICTQLYEYERPISAETFALIESAAQMMKMPPQDWLYVRELVRDRSGA